MSQSAFLPVKPYNLIGNRVRVKSSGLARGSVANARPRAVQHLQMPNPGTDKAGKCPAVARRGGGDWAQVELTDALPEKAKNIIKYS